MACTDQRDVVVAGRRTCTRPRRVPDAVRVRQHEALLARLPPLPPFTPRPATCAGMHEQRLVELVGQPPFFFAIAAQQQWDRGHVARLGQVAERQRPQFPSTVGQIALGERDAGAGPHFVQQRQSEHATLEVCRRGERRQILVPLRVLGEQFVQARGRIENVLAVALQVSPDPFDERPNHVRRRMRQQHLGGESLGGRLGLEAFLDEEVHQRAILGSGLRRDLECILDLACAHSAEPQQRRVVVAVANHHQSAHEFRGGRRIDPVGDTLEHVQGQFTRSRVPCLGQLTPGGRRDDEVASLDATHACTVDRGAVARRGRVPQRVQHVRMVTIDDQLGRARVAAATSPTSPAPPSPHCDPPAEAPCRCHRPAR